MAFGFHSVAVWQFGYYWPVFFLASARSFASPCGPNGLAKTSNGHNPVTLVEHWEANPIFTNSRTRALPAASCNLGGPQGISTPVAGSLGAIVKFLPPPLPMPPLLSTSQRAAFKARYMSDAKSAASASLGSVKTTTLRPWNFVKREVSNFRCSADSLLGATDSSISAASFFEVSSAFVN